MKNLSLLFFCFFSTALTGQSVDFTRLTLSVEFDTTKGQVDGLVSLNFTNQGEPDSIFLNGIRMNYREVELNGSRVDYDYNDEGIWLRPAASSFQDTNTIMISYTAQPRKGIYFIGWNDTTGLSRRQIWTQGQGIDHRHWIPHRDDQTDKLVTDISIIFDSKYKVISNGRLIGNKQISGDQKFWHYKMQKPMSSYLIALAIGDYDSTMTFSDGEVPLVQYYYPDREDDYEYYYHENEKIHNFIREEIGIDFPWQNYKQVPVQDFRHGAMENTTATIFGDFFLVDPIAFNDQNYTHVNAHELAHQWFGNLVTAQSSADHWLHEGFATYYQWLSEGHLYGKDQFDWERYKASGMVSEASRQDTFALNDPNAGSSRFYQKGGWVLHMLAERLGEEDFKNAIRHYLEEYQFGIVTTDSLAASVLETSGYDPREFFDQWVRTPGEPVIRVKHMGERNSSLYLEIKQDSVMPGFLFEIDTKLELVYEKGETEIVDVKITKITEHLEFSLKKDTALLYWNFDPGMNILGNVGEMKSLEMSKAQLERSDQLLDRYEAIQYLEVENFEKRKSELEKVLENEDEHYSMRREALRQIMESEHPGKQEILMYALRDDDVQLQKKAVEYVIQPDPEVQEILADLRKGRSYDLRKNAIHVSISRRDPEENRWLYDKIYELQPGIPGNQVHITALVYRVALFKDKEAFEELVKYTSGGYDFLTRINAMDVLHSLNLMSEDMMEYLFAAFFDPNWKLRSKAKSVLQHFHKKKKERKMIDEYIRKHENSWEDFQKRSVNRTFGVNQD